MMASRNTYVFIALLCAALAAGCAGGSGGNPRIAVPPGGGGITFPPTPSSEPTNNSWQPSPPPGESNSYLFSGVIWRQFIRPPIVQSPIPSPNPTVSAELVATSSITTNVTSEATFPITGEQNLVDWDTTEVDTGTVGEIDLVTTVSNTYYKYVADKNPSLTDVYEVGSTYNTEAGTPDQQTFTTVEGSGNGLLDVVPEPTKTGQQVDIQPANNAAQTLTEKDADGQLTTTDVNADGSYKESVSYPDGSSASAQETRGASGTTGFYSFPLDAVPQNSTVTVGNPVAGQIPITVVYAKGVDNDPNQKTVNVKVPDWYPQTPPVLYKQTYVNQGPTALPNPFPDPTPGIAGACNLGPVPPEKFIANKPWSNLLVQTTTTLDVIFGELETITSQVWNTEGVGLTCSQTTDVITQYYDYSGQSATIPYLQSTPVQVSTIVDQVGITQGTINSSRYNFVNGARHSQSLVSQGGAGKLQSRGQVQTQGQAESQGFSRGQEMLLVRSMLQQSMQQLARERLKRHALYWRQLKSLSRLNALGLKKRML